MSFAPPIYFTASWPKRITAYWMDSLISALCFLPVWIQAIGSYFEDGFLIVDINRVVASVLLVLFYHWIFLYFLGGTLGKLIMGLRVVSVHTNQELGLFQSFLRVLTSGLSIFFGDALRAFAFLRLDRRHVSDWVAETWVVQRSPLGHFPKRHWVIGLAVIFLSFTSSFMRAYDVIQDIEVEGGQILYDAYR